MDPKSAMWSGSPWPRLALGTRALAGGSEWPGVSPEVAVTILRTAYEGGIRFFDTAPSYGEGRAEEILGKLAREVGRDQVKIATKVGFREAPSGRFFSDLREEAILEDLEGSLRRLGMNEVDLLQVHWPDPRTPWEESRAVLEKVKSSGKAKAIGVCNFHGKLLRQTVSDTFPMDTLQVPFNPLDRRVEGHDLPLCRRHSLPVLAYSPLAMGLFSNRPLESLASSPHHARSHFSWFRREILPSIEKLRLNWQHYADQLESALAPLTIAWILKHQGITTVLLGVSSVEQVRSNLAAERIQLPPEMWQAMRKDLNAWHKESRVTESSCK